MATAFAVYWNGGMCVAGQALDISKISVVMSYGDGSSKSLIGYQPATPSYSSTGDYAWTNADGVWASGGKGVGSAQSNLSVSFTIDATSTLTFDWACSSESANYDYLYYSIYKDGSATALSRTGTSTKIGGNSDITSVDALSFATVSTSLEAGSYEVVFTYEKDRSANGGLDQGFVKNLSVQEPKVAEGVTFSATTLSESMIVNDSFEVMVSYTEDGKTYSSVIKIPVYHEPEPSPNGVAFAVYSADDNSLNFYKRTHTQIVGRSFNGKTATEVYTGIETDVYTSSTQPWYSYASSIMSVSFADEGIAPVSTAYWFYGMNNASLTTIGGLDKLNTANVTDMSSMFSNCSALSSLDVSGFDTTNVTSMGSMFRNCQKLSSLDVSSFNTAKVTDMKYMFYNCYALTSLNLSSFNTGNVTSMSNMFAGCSTLTSLNLSNFNTAKATDIRSMFAGCSELSSLDVSSFNTAKVTYMSNMFRNCQKLASLNLSNFNTANVTNMSYMFADCTALTSLNVTTFDTSKVTDMSSMFRNCYALTSLNLSNFNTAKVTDMRSMFYYCYAFTTIYAGDGWSTASVTSSSNMFYGCSKLPNYNSSVYDKTKAHYNSGGYLTYKQYIPKIVFVANSGLFQSDSSTTKSVQTNLDGTTSLSTLVEFPTKSGYVFRGWSTSSTGVVAYTPYATPTISNATWLYAVWEEAESYLIREDTLVNIADSIRVKEGTTDKILATDFSSRISSLPSGVKIVEGTITSHCSGKYHYGDITFDSEPKILLFGFGDSSYSGTISAGCFSYSEFKFIRTPASNPICCFYQEQGGGSDGYRMYELSSDEHVAGSGVYTNLFLYKNYSMAPDATPSTFWYKAYYWD